MNPKPYMVSRDRQSLGISNSVRMRSNTPTFVEMEIATEEIHAPFLKSWNNRETVNRKTRWDRSFWSRRVGELSRRRSDEKIVRRMDVSQDESQRAITKLLAIRLS